MSNQPRIRDVYQQYVEGRIPFDEVVRTADEILANYQASRAGDESSQSDSTPLRPGQAPRP